MDKLTDFVVFYIELYKEKNNMTGKEVVELFSDYGVIDYLKDNYDVMHTLGSEYVLDDIQKYIDVRKN